MTALDHMADGAFWVAFTFCAIILSIIFQGYWTSWAHRRVDRIKERMDELDRKCADMEKEVADLRDRNPFTLLKKVNR